MSIELSHGLAAVGQVQAVKQVEDSAVEHGHDEHGRFAGELQAVFAQGSIATPVAAVFDAPVCAQPGEQLCGEARLAGTLVRP